MRPLEIHVAGEGIGFQNIFPVDRLGFYGWTAHYAAGDHPAADQVLGPPCAVAVHDPLHRRQQPSIRIRIEQHPGAKLLQVAQAARGMRTLARPVQHRQQHSRQYRDDRYHHN